ncbi:MAG: porin [Rubrivivax sp.]|nr:porin [Rubrivivax sp.]
MTRGIRQFIRQPVLGACAAAALLLGAAPAQAGPTIAFGKEGSLTFAYSLQAWGQARDFTSSTDAGKSTDFFLRRNRFTAFGQFNDLVGYYANIDAPADSKGGRDEKSIFWRDAYITIDHSDALRLIVGRFKNAFSRENLEACFDPLTMDRAEVVSYTPWGGSRDTGVALWGNLADGLVNYKLMVSDGREGDAVVRDRQRVTARAHVSLLDPETDYGYRGTYLGTKHVLTIGAAVDYQPKVAYGDYIGKTDPKDYKAWTVDAFYEQPTAAGTFTIAAAVMKYDTGKVALGLSPDGTVPAQADLKAHYIKAGYLLPHKIGPGRLQLFGRFERSTYSQPRGYRDQKWAGIGAHYLISGQNLKLSLEFASVKFDVQNPYDPSQRDYKQATAGLQFIF